MLGSAWLRATTACGALHAWSPAAKLALLESIFGATCAALLAVAAATYTSSCYAGVFAAGMFAFSATVWKFSTHFEVFALNNLFCALLLYLSIRYLLYGSSWVPYGGAVVCGLALTNQHTVVLLEAPLIVSVIAASGGALLHPKRLLALMFLFCLGLVPYIYLPMASREAPMGSWGALDDWEGFSRHLLRREYGSLQLYTSGTPDHEAGGGSSEDGGGGGAGGWGGTVVERVRLNGRHLLYTLDAQSSGVMKALAPLGALSMLRNRAKTTKRRGVGLMLVSCVATYTAVFLPLANLPHQEFFEPILARFWMQPWLLLCLLMAKGLEEVLHTAPGRCQYVCAYACMHA